MSGNLRMGTPVGPKYTKLNFTEDGFVDYSLMELDNPPLYVPYSFEIIDWKWWMVYARDNWHFAIYAAVIYVTLIFGVQQYMKNRRPFHLKRELFLWNAAIGIFSIVGFIRFTPEFVVNLWKFGFYNSICTWQTGSMPMAFWGIMFALSKYVELGDTLFIVLRKKPLQVLQWYHHLATLVACWLTMPFAEPIGRPYAVMNYGVHSLMYPYFALKAMDVHIPKSIANLITTLQLTQMLMGLVINMSSAYYYCKDYWFNDMGVACYRHPASIKTCFLIYGTFAVLFGELFYKLVVKKKPEGKKAE